MKSLNSYINETEGSKKTYEVWFNIYASTNESIKVEANSEEEALSLAEEKLKKMPTEKITIDQIHSGVLGSDGNKTKEFTWD